MWSVAYVTVCYTLHYCLKQMVHKMYVVSGDTSSYMSIH